MKKITFTFIFILGLMPFSYAQNSNLTSVGSGGLGFSNQGFLTSTEVFKAVAKDFPALILTFKTSYASSFSGNNRRGLNLQNLLDENGGIANMSIGLSFWELDSSKLVFQNKTTNLKINYVNPKFIAKIITLSDTANNAPIFYPTAQLKCGVSARIALEGRGNFYGASGYLEVGIDPLVGVSSKVAMESIYKTAIPTFQFGVAANAKLKMGFWSVSVWYSQFLFTDTPINQPLIGASFCLFNVGKKN